MTYDYAILGGGAAGLSLALALVRSPLKAGSILIVEKDAKNTNDRTWCFWSDVPTPLDRIAYQSGRHSSPSGYVDFLARVLPRKDTRSSIVLV